MSSIKKMVMTKDFGAILCFYLLSFYIFFTARSYPAQPNIPMPQNPGFYPILLSILLIILATIHLIQITLQYRLEKQADTEEREESFFGESSSLTKKNLGVSVLMLFVFMYLFNWLGFATSTFIFLSVQSKILAPKETKTIKVLGFSLLATVVIFIIFSLLIGIRFPQGLLL